MKITIVVLLVLIGLIGMSRGSSCPCSDTSLCQPLSIGDRPEFLGFSLESDQYTTYDWSILTTVALFYSNPDPQLLCTAHSHGVRLVYGVGYPIEQLGNNTYQEEWIAQQLELVQSSYYDGLNFDFEDPIWQNESVTAALYTGLVAQTNTVFKQAFSGYQITVDVAWSPNCIDGRCYDYQGLAMASDYLVVMDYDTRSQVFSYPVCNAGANSPAQSVLEGMLNFTQLQIPVSKLVMGLPWYGYVYPCQNTGNSLNTFTCPIKIVPFRGVQCSDAAGSEHTYGSLMATLYNSSIESTGELWDDASNTPYFNYINPENGQLTQVWFDNAESLSIKVIIAKKLGLRGVSVWNIDFLDPQDQPSLSALMWDAMGSFFTPDN